MTTAFEKRLNELQEAGTLPGGVFVAADASGMSFLFIIPVQTPISNQLPLHSLSRRVG
jgi:hypothetical protein